MSVTIKSGAGSELLNVDATSLAARTTLYGPNGQTVCLLDDSFPANPYGIPTVGFNDGRAVLNRVDRFGSTAISLRQPLLEESFEGTVTNPIRWTVTATTMAATQTTVGGYLMNSGAITTINTGTMLQSTRRFQKTMRGIIHGKWRARLSHIANSVMEIGFGDAATFNGANTAGAYFQVTSAGVLQGVLTYNGVDITTAPITYNPTKYYTFDIVMDDEQATFYVQDTSTGALLTGTPVSLVLPLTGQRLLSATQIGTLIRLYNTGVAPASASQLILTDVSVGLIDNNLNIPVPHLQALQNRGATTNPFTGAQFATYGNNSEPGNATLSNTAAGVTTLGGKFQFAAPAGAITDFALFGYQVPVPMTFVMTGITIDTWNLGAVVATTPTLLTWAVGVGSTAVSLATATVTRFPLGAQSFAVGSAIGSISGRIDKKFTTPLVCEPGRFLHVILKVPVGTATASQVIAGMVGIEGYTI